MSATCSPKYLDILACIGASGLSVSQASTQVLPSGDVTQNPHYSTEENESYFSYQVIMNFGNTPQPGGGRKLLFFSIPVCRTLPLCNVKAVELLSINEPETIPLRFSFSENFNENSDFKHLKIAVEEHLISGGGGVFRIALTGRYPSFSNIKSSSFSLTTTDLTVTLPSTSEFCFPGFPKKGEITIVNSEIGLSNSGDSFELYNHLHVSNPSKSPLKNLAFHGSISYDKNDLILCTSEKNGENFPFDFEPSTGIKYSGNLPSLLPGKSDSLAISFPLKLSPQPTSHMLQGSYTVSNENYHVSRSFSCSLDVISIKSSIHSFIQDEFRGGFTFDFSNVPDSPEANFIATCELLIPKGITLCFTGLKLFNGVLPDGSSVRNNVGLTNTPVNFTFNFQLPVNSKISFPVEFKILSFDDFSGTYHIEASTESLDLISSNQFLLPSPLPQKESLQIVRVNDFEITKGGC